MINMFTHKALLVFTEAASWRAKLSASFFQEGEGGWEGGCQKGCNPRAAGFRREEAT